MSYNINLIDNVRLEKKRYFFDANIWLKILKPPFHLAGRDLKYIEFFQKFKNHPEHPKIVLITLVLSEVINRYLREVTFKQFCSKNKNQSPDPSYYKQVYRSSDQFQSDYISLCEDIKAYQNYYELLPDGLATQIKQKEILTSPPKSLDFNDLFYYKFAMKHGFILVTDDKDFFVPDVEILTYNNQLIERSKESVVIKPNNKI